jgi:hypothetical protein
MSTSRWNLGFITGRSSRSRDWLLCGALSLFSLSATIVPFGRALYKVQVNYNEGWNVYTASGLAHHEALYPSRFGWTTVNYPALSFFVMGALSRLTHEYLFTGRFVSILSLLICCGLVGAIVKRATGTLVPAILSAFFCLALFCARADGYVGMDDPQMLAQVFFLSGLLLYVSRGREDIWLVGTALLFVLGGSIKHNLIDFPLAVFLDLCIFSRRRAFHFVVYMAFFLAFAVVLNVLIGGPFFVAKLLTPRLYSVSGALKSFLRYYSIQVPFVAAAITMSYAIKNSSTRVIALFFVVSLIVGIGFAGGSGVAINTFFSNFLAISILVGIMIAMLWTNAIALQESTYLKIAIPVMVFGSLVFPMQSAGELHPVEKLQDVRMSEAQFEREVGFLQSQPGPALCESLLRCYFAGKPYIYDPFNSTSLIRLGKIDPGEVTDKIRTHEYGAIQLDSLLESMPRPNDRFVDQILDAIEKHYRPALEETDCAIYVPKAKIM